MQPAHDREREGTTAIVFLEGKRGLVAPTNINNWDLTSSIRDILK